MGSEGGTWRGAKVAKGVSERGIVGRNLGFPASVIDLSGARKAPDPAWT